MGEIIFLMGYFLMLAGVSIINLQERPGAVFRYDLTFLCE